MADITLVVDPARPSGSRESGRLRAAGRIPAIVYGHGIDPISVSVDAKDLRTALGGEAGSREEEGQDRATRGDPPLDPC